MLSSYQVPSLFEISSKRPVVLNDKIYFVSIKQWPYSSWTIELEVFDPSTLEWGKTAPLNINNALGFSCFTYAGGVYHNQLYVIVPNMQGLTYFTYQDETDTWKSHASIPWKDYSENPPSEQCKTIRTGVANDKVFLVVKPFSSVMAWYDPTA